MTDEQAPQQEQQQVISKAGLTGLYVELGEARHTIHELQARLAAIGELHQKMVAEHEAFVARHASGKCAPIVDVEPTPIDRPAARQKGTG